MQTQNKVTLNRTFKCSASELFQWLIQPDRIAQWFGPEQLSVGQVLTNPVEGGTYSIELIKPNGVGFEIAGQYQEVSPPLSLTFSLHYEGLSSPPPNSIVRMTIAPDGSNESTLHFVQEFQLTPSDMANRTVAWEYMFDVLKSLTSN